MSAWTAGALAATLALGVCGFILVRGRVETRLVALQLATTIAAVDMLVVAQSFGNSSAFDIALAATLLSFPAGLIYANFYGRWL